MPAKPSSRLFHGVRNDRLLDAWSLVHLVVGAAAGWLVHPWWGLAVLAAWEPFEILVLGPWIWRRTGRRFGNETWRNSLSDLLFDAVGVAFGALVLRALLQPPYVLFG